MSTQDVATTTPTVTGVVQGDPPQQPTLGQRIVSMEHQFALAAPKGVEARQLVRDAMVALSKTPKLAECTPNSVLGGLMTMAQLGLRVGVLGHGWILPFWNSRAEWTDGNGRQQRGAFEAQLVIGYQGLVELAQRSHQIASISARSVRENDHFDLEYGIDERLVHRPATKDRGEATGYYAVVRIKGGGHTFYYMSHDEMLAYRDRFAMAKKDGKVVGPWRDHFEQMALKTCVRQLAKFMPKGTDLAIALAADESVRVDISPDADIAHVSDRIEAPSSDATPHVDTDGPPAEGALFDEGGQS